MITSLTNDKVKELVKLKEKKHREAQGRFIVEGEHLVLEAEKAGILLEVFSLDERGQMVSKDVMKKITNTDSIPKIIGVCKLENKQEIGDYILLLDTIQDPGNMGTLIRSAVSFGFKTIVLNKGCCDPYSPKVVRSTEGALFQINLIFDEILPFVDKLNGYDIYGTSLVNGIPLQHIERTSKMGIILGNEGKGVNKEILTRFSNIFIEMKNMESLNVGVAGSIIMYNLSNRE